MLCMSFRIPYNKDSEENKKFTAIMALRIAGFMDGSENPVETQEQAKMFCKHFHFK